MDGSSGVRDPSSIKDTPTGLSLGDISNISGGQLNLAGRDINQYYTPEILDRLLPKLPPPPPLPDPGFLPDPALLTPGSRLIFPRNNLFTGRQADLLDLAQALFYSSAPQPLVVIRGIGGIGKTQLAVELAYRYSQYLHGVHWITTSADLTAEIASCGQAMTLIPWPEKIPEQVALTLAIWQRQPERLVILDNLEDLDLLDEWLPRLGAVRLLVTTRRMDFSPALSAHILDLGTLHRLENLALLRKLAPRLADYPDSALDPLAGRLYDLPLALHLAGSLLALQPSLSPAAYLSRLEEAGGPLQPNPPALALAKSPTRHELDLYATFQVSWNQLDPADPFDQDAGFLFLACGYCAPNTTIPHDLLAKVLEPPPRFIAPASLFQRLKDFFARRPSPDVEDETVVAEEDIDQEADIDLLLHRLASLGLLEPSPSIHPLLAEFARMIDSQEGYGVLPSIAGGLEDLAYKANVSGFPSRVAPYRPYLTWIIPFVQPVSPSLTVRLLNNLGYYLKTSGDLHAARPYLERALEVCREALDERHPDTALSLNNLGWLLQDLGDLTAARPLLEEALVVMQKIYGKKDPKVAVSLNNLGSLSIDMGDLNAARKYMEKALAIRRKAFGERHPATARSLNNLGSLLDNLGDLPAARKNLELALDICRQTLGERHPDTAVSYGNLGKLLHHMGELSTARSYLENTLAIHKEILGDEHPYISTDLNNLGLVLQDLGDLSTARQYFEAALSIAETVLGPDHPDTQIVRNNLAALGGESPSTSV